MAVHCKNDNDPMNSDETRIVYQRRMSIYCPLQSTYEPPANNTTQNNEEPTYNWMIWRLQCLTLFKFLEKPTLEKLTRMMIKIEVTKHCRFINDTMGNNTFFLIQKGETHAYENRRGRTVHIGTYGKNECLNEVALLHPPKYKLSAIATLDTVAWSLDRSTYSSLVTGRALRQTTQNLSFIKSVDFLDFIQANQKLYLADSMVPIYYKDGGSILEKGSKIRGIYFISHGMVSLSDGRCNEVKLRRGNFFGLTSLTLQDEFAKVAFRAHCPIDGDVKVLYLKKEVIMRLVGPLEQISSY